MRSGRQPALLADGASPVLAAAIGLALLPIVYLSWSHDPAAIDASGWLRSRKPTIWVMELSIIILAVLQGINWRSFYRRDLVVPAMLLVVIAFGTALFVAPDQANAISRNLQYLLHAGFFVGVVTLIQRGLRIRDLARAYLVGLLIYIIAIGIYAAGVPDDTGFSWRDNMPATSNIRQYGFYAGPLAAFALGWGLLGEKATGPRLFSYLVGTAAIGFCAWTGSRGAIYALVLGFVAAPVLFPALRTRSYLIVVGLSLLIGMSVAAALPIFSGDMGVWRNFEVRGELSAQNFTTNRTVLWSRTISAIAEQPLFGYGDGQLRYIVDFHNMPQPHNLFLQVAVAWGVVGLALFSWIGLRVGWESVKRVRARPELTGAALLILVALIFSMVDGVFYRTVPLSITAACLAMIWAPKRSDQQD